MLRTMRCVLRHCSSSRSMWPSQMRTMPSHLQRWQSALWSVNALQYCLHVWQQCNSQTHRQTLHKRSVYGATYTVHHCSNCKSLALSVTVFYSILLYSYAEDDRTYLHSDVRVVHSDHDDYPYPYPYFYSFKYHSSEQHNMQLVLVRT